MTSVRNFCTWHHDLITSLWYKLPWIMKLVGTWRVERLVKKIGLEITTLALVRADLGKVKWGRIEGKRLVLCAQCILYPYDRLAGASRGGRSLELPHKCVKNLAITYLLQNSTRNALPATKAGCSTVGRQLRELVDRNVIRGCGNGLHHSLETVSKRLRARSNTCLASLLPTPTIRTPFYCLR